MPLIDLIAGARPNFIKIASIARAITARKNEQGPLRFRIVHTGQHYDAAMSESFFRQLQIPDPDVNLEVGSGTAAEQTAAIMVRYERLLAQARCSLCLVVGDVTSTMACAVTAQKLGIPVAHVEGGIRSGDWSMPEEINRLVTDSISNWFFTTSEFANANLAIAGINPSRVFFVGNTMIDTLVAHRSRFQAPALWEDFGLLKRNYFVLTLHRPANVDDEQQLSDLLETVAVGSRGNPVVFPVHPRTQRVLERLTRIPSSIIVSPPQPYLEFNYLVENAKAVITDSGGITEEATFMGIPCFTLRTSTERPETVSYGTNELLGVVPSAILAAFDRLFAGNWKAGTIPPLWDGRAGDRIASRLEEILGEH